MRQFTLLQLSLATLTLASTIVARPVYAITLTNPLGPGADSIPDLVARIIRVALGLVGVIAIVMLVYAGMLWMTAGGNTKRVETATATIKWTLIGILIIVAAGAISSFVVEQLATVGA